jgi:hypothetical protein
VSTKADIVRIVRALPPGTCQLSFAFQVRPLAWLREDTAAAVARPPNDDDDDCVVARVVTAEDRAAAAREDQVDLVGDLSPARAAAPAAPAKGATPEPAARPDQAEHSLARRPGELTHSHSHRVNSAINASTRDLRRCGLGGNTPQDRRLPVPCRDHGHPVALNKNRERTTAKCNCCGATGTAWRCTGGCDYDMCSSCHAAWWGSHNGLDPTAANGYMHDNTAQRAREAAVEWRAEVEMCCGRESPAAPAVGVRARLSLPVSPVERANVQPRRHFAYACAKCGKARKKGRAWDAASLASHQSSVACQAAWRTK